MSDALLLDESAREAARALEPVIAAAVRSAMAEARLTDLRDESDGASPDELRWQITAARDGLVADLRQELETARQELAAELRQEFAAARDGMLGELRQELGSGRERQAEELRKDILGALREAFTELLPPRASTGSPPGARPARAPQQGSEPPHRPPSDGAAPPARPAEPAPDELLRTLRETRDALRRLEARLPTLLAEALDARAGANVQPTCPADAPLPTFAPRPPSDLAREAPASHPTAPPPAPAVSAVPSPPPSASVDGQPAAAAPAPSAEAPSAPAPTAPPSSAPGPPPPPSGWREPAASSPASPSPELLSRLAGAEAASRGNTELLRKGLIALGILQLVLVVLVVAGLL